MSEVVALRPARAQDVRRLWQWRNDPAVRRASFSQKPIGYAQHRRWFAAALKDRRRRIFVVQSPEGKPVGYVRGWVEGGQATLSVGIAAAHRSRGFGSRAIRLGAQRLLKWKQVKRVVGLVKARNAASQAAFSRAGFRNAGKRRVGRSTAAVMVLNRRAARQPMARPAVLFCADVGPKIGWGHLQRCLALAAALRRRGMDAFFMVAPLSAARRHVRAAGFGMVPAAKQAARTGWDAAQISAVCRRLGIRLVVMDSYHVKASDLRRLGDAGLGVVMIDDHARHPMFCRLVINGGAHAQALRYRTAAQTKLLRGPRYALLRPEFGKRLQRMPAASVKHVLVMLGGGDSSKLMPKILKAIRGVEGSFSVSVVLGPLTKGSRGIKKAAAGSPRPVRLISQPRHIKRLMVQADAAVSGAGQTLYELACTGCPAVAVAVAENQKLPLEKMDKRGCVLSAGSIHASRAAADIREALQRLVDDDGLRRRMAARGQAYVDGLGALRAAKAIEALIARN